MKNILKILISLILLLSIVYMVIDEPIPKGTKNEQAQLFADKLLQAINYDKWQQTKVVTWEFPRGHIHTWDKERNFSEVRWDDNRVIFQIDSLKGIAYQNDTEVKGVASEELIKKAWQFWANDSFWLNAPAKIRDGGTEQQLVELDNGKTALLVRYHAGGVTPGDSYLWICDENYLPLYCKMWVSIIPIGGLKFNWNNWITLSTGAKVAQNHNGVIDVNLKNIKAAFSISEMFPNGDPFKALVDKLN